jgi:hypothetical protein
VGAAALTLTIMALITCPDCSTQISSLATACPKCGYPVFRNSVLAKLKLKSRLLPTLLLELTFKLLNQSNENGRTAYLRSIRNDINQYILAQGRFCVFSEEFLTSSANLVLSLKQKAIENNVYVLEKDLLNAVIVGVELATIYQPFSTEELNRIRLSLIERISI